MKLMQFTDDPDLGTPYFAHPPDNVCPVDSNIDSELVAYLTNAPYFGYWVYFSGIDAAKQSSAVYDYLDSKGVARNWIWGSGHNFISAYVFHTETVFVAFKRLFEFLREHWESLDTSDGISLERLLECPMDAVRAPDMRLIDPRPLYRQIGPRLLLTTETVAELPAVKLGVSL